MAMVIDRENLKKVAKLHTEIEKMKKELDAAKDILKTEMVNAKTNKLSEEGITVTIAESERTTVAKDAVQQLMNKGLITCIKSVPEVDVDRLELEVGIRLTQDEFDELVTKTPYKRMTIK